MTGSFLTWQDGTIITHPSKEYQLGKNVDVKVENSIYKEIKDTEKVKTLYDYDKRIKTIICSNSDKTPFKVYMVNDWIVHHLQLITREVTYRLENP